MSNLIRRYALPLLIVFGIIAKAALMFEISLNSDDVQPALIFHDMFSSSNYLLRGWYLVTNSQLLIEYPVYAFLGLAGGMSMTTLRVGCLAIFMASAGAASMLAWRLWGRQAGMVAAAYVLCLPLFPSLIMLHIFNHIAAIALSLVSVHIALLAVGPGTNRRAFHIAALAGISVVTAFSDPYYIASCTVPLALAMIAAEALDPDRSGIRARLAIVAALVAGSIAGLALQGLTWRWGLYLSKLPSDPVALGNLPSQAVSYAKTLASIYDMDVRSPRSFLNLMLFLVTIVAGAYVTVRERSRQRRVALYYIVSLTVLMSASYITKAVVAARYLTPLLYGSGIFLGAALSGDYIRGRYIRGIAMGVFMVAAMLSAVSGMTHKETQGSVTLAGVLEKEGLTYGYSDYWHANVVTAMTGDRVKVRAVEFADFALRPHYWVSKDAWYKPSSHEGGTFLVVPRTGATLGLDQLSPALIAQLLGPPARTLMAENADIYVWPYNIMLANLPAVPINASTPHTAGTFEGSALHAKAGERGWLITGPNWTLDPGRYRVRFTISAQGVEGTPAGRVEVMSANRRAAKFEPSIKSKPITARAEGGWAVYSIDFDATGHSASEDYEFRLFTDGNADIRLSSVTLEALSRIY